jgi:hypothetical protein
MGSRADRELIDKGADPIEAKKAAQKTARPVPTFGDLARSVIADAQSKSVNAKVRYQWGAPWARPIPAPC